eukprot:NODE_982_length_1185_cov_89.846831_g742_i0.p1 GENE.NODE_982_length_1185_cov_89.846831_g742_i0~~NODE_982_length_1185_cov_89.846831_g742_i0.p1  ORF type:complete len:257 (+),score=32.95 NODE_982_length_1185_cov_89.846831_g742_i0:73-843(+)
MSELVNELTVVTKIWNLSKDPQNQPYIVRRNILPTLLKFLQYKEQQFVERSADTLKLLSSHEDNPEYMCREKGLVQIVVGVLGSTEYQSVKVTLACVLRNLHSAIPGNEKPVAPAAPTTETTGGEDPSPPVAAQLLHVSIPSMDAFNCKDIEAHLLTLTGVVSCTSDNVANMIKIYSKIDGQAILDHLKATNIEGHLVDKDTPSEYQQSLVASGENSLAARLEKKKQERLTERQQRQAAEGTMGRFFRRLTTSFWG